jgi:hypothetical protein
MNDKILTERKNKPKIIPKMVNLDFCALSRKCAKKIKWAG